MANIIIPIGSWLAFEGCSMSYGFIYIERTTFSFIKTISRLLLPRLDTVSVNGIVTSYSEMSDLFTYGKMKVSLKVVGNFL